MSDQEWVVEVPTPNWVTKMNNQLTRIADTRSTESKRWQMQSIYRIPQCVKELRSTTASSSIGPYDPQMVSIGPYHHGKQQLQGIEEHKQRALLTFLDRSKKPLHSYVDALMPVVEDLKEAYHDLDPKWKQDTEAFLQLMIVDGCFILEIMRATSAKPTTGYADEDPIFSNHGRLYFVPYLRRDMLMLENQLPLRLLFELLLVEDGGIIMSNGYSKQDHLSVLILEFFSLPHDLESIQEFKNCLHILDMYRRSMLMHLSCGRTAKPKKSCSDCLPSGGKLKNEDAYIRSATELKEAGIRFEQSETCNLNDVSFKGGVLRLPLILVDDALESQYLNMMALERFHVGLGNHVTSFVFFMDSIIDSARDVALLHSYGIIQNALGSDKAVANLFNSLLTDATLDANNALGIVKKQVADYCGMLLPSINDEQWTVQVNGEINGGETSSVLAGEWESEVNTELNKLKQTRSTELKQWKGTSIYRIPLSLKKLQRSAYQPQTVSIGPYHHGQLQLAAMEKHKQRAFLTFLARSKKSLRCYVDGLAPVVEDLKDAYDQLQPKWKQDTEAFLKLMIVDGCFMLEIMRTTTTKAEAPCRAAYSSNDPVFGDHGKIYLAPSIKRDMLMLENQLPLLLLNKLVIAEGSSLSKQDKLTTLILKFFKPRERQNSNIQPLRNCLHILHLYRESLLNNNQRKRSSRICQLLHKFCHKEAEDDSIRSATELTDAGIRFELSKTRYLNDITFRRGVLRLPQITVDDAAESQCLNLMALERLHVGLGNEVTSYVYFMDNIIDSAKDVSLLHWQGIIQSSLGSDKAVASMFNSLSREGLGSHLSRVQQDVADYCRLPVPKWMAYAKHTYFTNPWVSLSIAAAISLFALTILQTLYAILAYHKKDPETIPPLP